MNLHVRTGNRARTDFLAVLVAAFAACVPAAETVPPPPAAPAIELRLVGGRLEGGVRTLRFKRGERVAMRFTSDQRVTLHLHGYDVELPLSPAMEATLVVDARVAGRFPLGAHFPAGGANDHPRERTLLYVEVLPE